MWIGHAGLMTAWQDYDGQRKTILRSCHNLCVMKTDLEQLFLSCFVSGPMTLFKIIQSMSACVYIFL